MACEIRTRPMTPGEKNLLKRLLARPKRSPDARPRGVDLAMGALIGLIIGVLPALSASEDHSAVYAASVWAGAGLLGLLIAAVIDWRRSGPVRERRALYQWELSEGVVTEFDCTVSAAIEIYEGADERSTYLLQVEPRRVLYLNGHYLYDKVDAFPAEKFRLARAPHSWEVLTFEAAGPRIASVPMVASTELRRRDLNDGDLLDGVIADFVKTA